MQLGSRSRFVGMLCHGGWRCPGLRNMSYVEKKKNALVWLEKKSLSVLLIWVTWKLNFQETTTKCRTGLQGTSGKDCQFIVTDQHWILLVLPHYRLIGKCMDACCCHRCTGSWISICIACTLQCNRTFLLGQCRIPWFWFPRHKHPGPTSHQTPIHRSTWQDHNRSFCYHR